MDPWKVFYVAAVASFVLVAAVSDYRTRRLPNWLTVPACGAAIVLHTVVNGLTGLQFAALGFATGFSILLVLWFIGGSGGGDVKLMGALGAWLGASLTIHVFLFTAALAAVLTSVAVSYGMLSRGFGSLRRSLSASTAGSTGHGQGSRTGSKVRQRRGMPYAVPVAAGTCLVLAYAWVTSVLPW